MIEISVVIPTYNREKLIVKAIESVISQEGQGISYQIKEIIIADDCSTDETGAVIEKYIQEKADDDTKIIYHRLSENKGPGGARNEGAAIAKSEYIAFQDSDDLWHPDKLKVMTEYMKEHPGTELYSHYYEALLSGDRTVLVDAPQMEDYFPELAMRNLIGAPTIIVKKDAFREVGGFDEEMRALEDWDFALRFAYRYRIRFVPQVLMTVDLVGEGVSSKAGNYYDARARILAKNRQILMERGLFNPAVEKLFLDAQEKGILKEVGAILEGYLRGV